MEDSPTKLYTEAVEVLIAFATARHDEKVKLDKWKNHHFKDKEKLKQFKKDLKDSIKG